MSVPPVLHVRLLGAFELRVDAAVLPRPDSARTRSLVAAVALGRGEPVARGRLAGLLWPESTEAQARTNLRHLLHTVRRVMPDAADRIEVTAADLRWASAPASTLDVAEFEALLDAADPGDAGGRLAAVRSAVALYRGDLLEGSDDDWVVPERERLAARFAAALAELAGLAEAAGDGAGAIAAAERLLRADPLRESGYQLLMRLHAAHGDRAGALRAFHRCSSTLERELGVAPSEATRAQYRALLPPEVPAPAAGDAGGRSVPMVGRDAERARLGAAWRDAGAGIARLAVITGEPGVGKTRLVEEFRSWCARGGGVTAQARCYAAEGPLPYGPISAWLRSPALRPAVLALDRVRLAELARLLPELLVDEPGMAAPEAVPEDEQRPRVFDAVSAAIDTLGGSASGGPSVLLVADDLQHADRESCRLLHYLLRSRPATRLLVVATARAGEVDHGPVAELMAAVRERDLLLDIRLERLDPAATADLLGRITGVPVPGADAARLHAQTGGNPLFLVEAVRAGWRPGSRRAPVTPRVRALLDARLAQLSPASRELAAAAAVVGRPFHADLLVAAAWGEESGTAGVEDALVAGLDELWRRGIVLDSGDRIGAAGSAGTYDFAHETLREAAAAELSPVRRARVHRRVAAALERSGSAGGAMAAEIAAHHAQAGDALRAATWYLRAAQSAQLLYAHAESVRLLERALDVLDPVAAGAEPDPRRDEVELDLRTALLAPLVSEHGYASPEVAAAQAGLAELHRRLDRPPSAPLLRSLAMTALTQDDFDATRSFAGRLRMAGEADASGVLAVEAAVLLGFAAFWQADLVVAAGHLERAVTLFRPEHTRTHLVQFGQDPQAVALARLANTRWLLGDPAATLDAGAAALARAAAVGHPYTRAAVRLFAALLALDMADDDAVREHTAALVGTGVQAMPLRLSAAALAGRVAVLDGEVDAGLARIRKAVAESAGGAGAPGMRAILARIELAACVGTGDAALVLAAAEGLLAAGPAARVWAPAAHRARAAFHPGPG